MREEYYSVRPAKPYFILRQILILEGCEILPENMKPPKKAFGDYGQFGAQLGLEREAQSEQA